MTARSLGTIGRVAAVVMSSTPCLAGQDDASTMAMNPCFSTLNYPVPRDTMMVMALSEFQAARSTHDFFTGMGMVQYGLTSRWTVGVMVEGQKIVGLPATYGGLRVARLFACVHTTAC